MTPSLILLLALFLLSPSSSSDTVQGVDIEITDLGECAGCARGIVRAMTRLDGVNEAELLPEAGVVRVAVDDGVWLDPEELRDVVRNVGYTSGKIEIRCRGTVEKDSDRPTFLPASRSQDAVIIDDPDALIDGASVEVVALLVQSASMEVPSLAKIAP